MSTERCPTCGSEEWPKLRTPFTGELVDNDGPYAHCPDPRHASPGPPAQETPQEMIGTRYEQLLAKYEHSLECVDNHCKQCCEDRLLLRQRLKDEKDAGIIRAHNGWAIRND